MWELFIFVCLFFICSFIIYLFWDRVLVCSWTHIGLAILTKVALNSQSSTSLCLLWARVKDFYHYAQLFYNVLYLFVCVCTHLCVHMYMAWHMRGDQWTLLGSWSSIIWSQGLNLGCQAWRQVPLPIEPAHWSKYYYLDNNLVTANLAR